MTKASVLVVDDEPDSRDALSMTLRLMGYDVSTAKDGLDALQVVTQHRPHAIVTDIGMPLMDGTALCFRLKSDPMTTEIPIIVCSALNEIHPVLNEHIARFLRKPVDIDELDQVIQLCLEQTGSGVRANRLGDDRGGLE